MTEIAFVGGGVMGSALAQAAVQGVAPRSVVVADIDAQKGEAVRARLGCRVTIDNRKAVKDARFVTFCVKPHLLHAVLVDLAPVLQARETPPVIVTVVPAVTAETYRTVLGIPNLSVIRLVPNTACTVGKGLSLIMEDDTYTAEQVAELQVILADSGKFDILPPAQYVPGAVVASTAPAFIGVFAAALEDAGVYIGLPRDRARRYALECLVSTGQMLLENGKHCEAVKEDVCSPAGAGIRGVRALEQHGLRGAVFEAIISTHEQYQRLGDISKK